MSPHLPYLSRFLSPRGLLCYLTSTAMLSNSPCLLHFYRLLMDKFYSRLQNTTGLLFTSVANLAQTMTTVYSSHLLEDFLCASPSVNQLEIAWEQILMAVSLTLFCWDFCFLLELLVPAHSGCVPVLGSVLTRCWHLLDLTCFCSVLLRNSMW